MKPYLKLTDTGHTDGGLRIFALDLYVSGKIAQTWHVNSGQPDHQDLFAYNDPDSYSGDQRPIPESVYNIGPLEFAGGKFDWKDSWGPGLGDFWASIVPVGGETKRKAFGFHWDENRGRSPGSLGCVVFPTRKDVESFVTAMRKHNPAQLFVDYGLGTILRPKTEQPTASAPNKPVIKAADPDVALVTLDNEAIATVPMDGERATVTWPAVCAVLGLAPPMWDPKSRTVILSSRKK